MTLLLAFWPVALALAFVVQRPADAGATPAVHHARPSSDISVRADSRPDGMASPGSRHSPSSRAPAAAPLLGPTGPSTGGGDEPQAGGSPAAETDPLVRNGLGSPLCSGASGGASLSGGSRRNCETSSFIGSAAPTGNFGIDVHIDTGFLGFSSAQLQVLVQNLFLTPVWMALVWAVHALIVMLEWCFTLESLDGGPTRSGVASALRELQVAITMPWLALVLAAGAVLCAYHGLVRRRVADSLAQALLALAMTAGGIWVAVDPTGTVGALGDWANEASVGTLAVTARGSPAKAGGTLADGFGAIFAAAIEVPWCYLEFGDVDWCRSPARLDPRLRSAALALARSELTEAGCGSAASRSGGCAAGSGPEAKLLERSARLLRMAQSNGAIFLALPPNGPARNAINDPSSLLRAICGNDEATACRGEAAAQAEFRTNRGTWPRVGGLLLIVVGIIGLLLLLGFIALRLLGAALFSLLYLMLAPAVALAPALGEAGRAAFRKWIASLFAAVVSKLLFAFLLGVVLAILALLEQLQALGWWTRWLLMSAFWWGTFLRRHEVLQLAGGEGRGDSRARRSPLRRAGESLGAPVAAYERIRAARERFRKRAADPASQSGGSSSGPPARRFGASVPEPSLDAQIPSAEGAIARPSSGAARSSAASGTAFPVRYSGSERNQLADAGGGFARLERIADQHNRALAAGNSRRAARLASRVARLEAEHADQEHADHHGHPAFGRSPARADPHEREARYASFLDVQARLPEANDRGMAMGPRNYAGLAGIAGYGRREYIQLDGSNKQAARQLIDRELALRREMMPGAVIARGARSHEGRESAAEVEDRADTDDRFDGTPLIPARFDPRRAGVRPGRAGPSESIVMKDALEITARRRRQLGGGRR